MVQERLATFMPQNLRTRLKPALVRWGYYSRPAFLILGGVKCGSTALHRYLCDHPQIVPAWDKEVHFFDRDVSYEGRGVEWYHSRFPPPYKLGRDKITFEATPNYLYHFPRCAPRIREYQPDMKLIALLRDPVERAYSFWNMLRVFSLEDGKSVFEQEHLLDPSVQAECEELYRQSQLPSFESFVRREMETLDDPRQRPEMSFVRAGLYAEQIEHYWKHFDREQLLLLESGQLLRDTRATLDRVTDFLELPRHSWSAYTLQKIGAYPYDGEMDGAIREELRAFYRPYNERLYEMLGTDFGW